MQKSSLIFYWLIFRANNHDIVILRIWIWKNFNLIYFTTFQCPINTTSELLVYKQNIHLYVFIIITFEVRNKNICLYKTSVNWKILKIICDKIHDIINSLFTTHFLTTKKWFDSHIEEKFDINYQRKIVLWIKVYKDWLWYQVSKQTKILIKDIHFILHDN